MIEASHETLEEGLRLSRRLLELMKEEEWDKAADLEVTRLQTIKKALAAEPGQGMLDKIELLREIVALTQEVEAIGQERKSQLSCQLRKIHKGRKLEKAYR